MQPTPDRLFAPFCLALATAFIAGTVAVARVPADAGRPPVATRVLGAVVTPSPLPTLAPTPEPVTVPVDAPRVSTPRRRTSGPVAPKPVPRNAWVSIPSIGARGPVVSVGLDPDGNMVTPKNARDVAWLDNGSFPGPTRNAILAGHRNWRGASGTFIKLEKAKPGDAIIVGLDGRNYTFTITWVRTVDPDNANVEEIMGETTVDSVTLVTCGGDFNRKTRHYEQRVVARGELVSVG